MVLLAVLVCLRLGLWQWHRTHESDGTIQNLGYTILWPVFGAAFVYMWVRFLQLEVLKDAEDDAELTAMAAGTPGRDAEGQGPQARAMETGSSDQAGLTSIELPSGSPGTVPGVQPEPSERAQLNKFDERRDAEQDAPSNTSAAGNVSVTHGARSTPSRGYTVAVSTVGGEAEDQDPELAAYNRALAALAEKDHRRAR